MSTDKILIVEDEIDIRELIHFHLYNNKFEVLETSNGLDAIYMVETHNPALILLDIMIPGLNGLEVCRRIKENQLTQDIKIIFISAKGEEEDIIKGLELGGDDYVTKPFSPKVLMARVRSVLRRGKKDEENILDSQGVTLDENKYKALIDGADISLSASEYQILKFLMTSPGHVYTRGQIVNKIKGYNHAVTDRSVDTQLVSLRKKMGDKGKLVETVWGVGYRFRDAQS